MRWSATAVVTVLVACGGERVAMRGAAYRADEAPSSPGDAATTFPLPGVGEAVAATLPQGWPVWIVHHADGAVSVLSAVAVTRANGRDHPGFFERDAGLVRWISGVRRFVAGNLVYDERGHVLGYPDFDGCLGDCPADARGYPRSQRDLDAFEVQVAGTEIRAGVRHEGAIGAVAITWIPWRRTDDAGRRLDMTDFGRSPIPPGSIAAAVARPVGSYAIIAGAIVRATFDVPRVCTQTHCERCPQDAPPVTGVSGDRANVPSVEGQQGVFLLRREAAGGFAVIARIAAGSCGGGGD